MLLLDERRWSMVSGGGLDKKVFRKVSSVVCILKRHRLSDRESRSILVVVIVGSPRRRNNATRPLPSPPPPPPGQFFGELLAILGVYLSLSRQQPFGFFLRYTYTHTHHFLTGGQRRKSFFGCKIFM
uniref:Uncharacterized protein n=1 Tax=Octopus bimaculoides TaxID=37653 RepID=A0A0L8I1S3_OCTBM